MTTAGSSFGAFPLSTRYALRRGAGRHARRVRHLGGTSDRRREALERAGSACIALLGTRPWPTTQEWPWPPLGADDLVERLRSVVPSIVIDAAARPRQPGRARLSLLGRVGSDDVVVKLGPPGDGIETEARALRALTEQPLPGIATPAIVASGSLDVGEPVAVVVTAALGLEGQRAAIHEPLRTFERDLARRLDSLPRPHDCPPDWVPTHGDLTPWNLRRTPFGLALFDWEAAAWRPPGHDLDHYHHACAVLRR